MNNDAVIPKTKLDETSMLVSIAAMIQSYLGWLYSIFCIACKKTKHQPAEKPIVVKEKKKHKHRKLKILKKPKHKNKPLLHTMHTSPTPSIAYNIHQVIKSQYTKSPSKEGLETPTIPRIRKRDVAKHILRSTFKLKPSLPSSTSSSFTTDTEILPERRRKRDIILRKFKRK